MDIKSHVNKAMSRVSMRRVIMSRAAILAVKARPTTTNLLNRKKIIIMSKMKYNYKLLYTITVIDPPYIVT